MAGERCARRRTGEGSPAGKAGERCSRTPRSLLGGRCAGRWHPGVLRLWRGREPLQSIDGTAWFGVRVLRHWEDRREAARVGYLAGLGSACSDFIEGALVETNKPSSPVPAAPPKGLVSSPRQREWGSLWSVTASLPPLPAASVKPQIPV